MQKGHADDFPGFITGFPAIIDALVCEIKHIVYQCDAFYYFVFADDRVLFSTRGEEVDNKLENG